MFSKIKQGIKKKIFKTKKTKGSINPFGKFTVLPDDTFLVSYPKSGNTWLRFLIANLMYLDHTTVSFSNIDKLIPDIYQNHDQDLLKLSTPRILKSHSYFDARYPKVIYIVRDPRDVAISYYKYLIKNKKVEEDYSIDLWIKPFIEGKFNPQFKTWSENVESWLSSKNNADNFLLIKYEDMLVNSFDEMLKIASFLQLTKDYNHVKKAIELSSADRMRKLERQTKWQPEKNSKKNIPFVRTAKSGNWKTDLSEYAVKEIENNWQSSMQKLNYLD